MRVELSRRYRVSASHRLHAAEYSEEKNRAVFGKCNNPHGHGHNYVIEVTLGGPVDAVTGMVCDLAELDAFAQRELVGWFDHKNLNTIACFKTVVPSTENFAIEVWRIFSEGFTAAKLVRVRIEETGNNSFEYTGGTVPERA